MPSVLWRCRLGDRKGIWPVKTEWWGAGVVISLQRGPDLHMAHLMPLPLAVSCFSKIQIGFTFLVPAHPGSPGQRSVKRVCVCVCVTYFLDNVDTGSRRCAVLRELRRQQCHQTDAAVYSPQGFRRRSVYCFHCPAAGMLSSSVIMLLLQL